MELIVSVSGVRGIVGQALTPAVALAYAAALGTYLRGGPVLLSRDSRPTGPVLRHAALAGLLGTGCEVIDVGVVPTPTVGLAVTRLQAAGALQITASHNPAPWNGLKAFGADGGVLNADRGLEVKTLFEAGKFMQAAWDKLGTMTENHQASSWHRDRVLELVDVAKIRGRKFRVFLDANGGAGGSLGGDLLEALGTFAKVQGGNLDGVFLHPPEPTEENLQSVLPWVPACSADVGFVLDPDADRLAIIDETGRYIGEELTLALAVQFRLSQAPGPVVINMSTSRVIEDLALKAGVPCQRTAVGEANVVQGMRAAGALLGGEGNGGVIDPRVGWVRDPFIGMALILNLLADTGKTVSQLVAALPSYAIVKDKYTVPFERLTALKNSLLEKWPDARFNLVDGLRLDWEKSWVHIRASNTEPIVRVIAEAPTRAEAEKLCGDVGKLVNASGA